MAFYLDRLESIQKAIAEVFEQQSNDGSDFAALKERVSFLATGTNDLAGDLEICFKLILSSYLDGDSGIMDGINVEKSPQIRLIAFAFDFALQYKETTDNVPKIPFQLIEDVLEHQTIHQAKQIWTIIESWVSRITNPLMFTKGKLVILKTCNSLLRKLSKSCDTEFCGRILMFLADVFPLSEPSALNLAGKINTANVTYYDSADKFVADTDLSTSATAGSQTETPSITYELYESFWKLQSCFAANAKPFEGASFDDFLKLAKKTVDVFSLAPLNSSSSQKQKMHNGSLAYQGNKYLTSSQLFTLQLNDPSLRQQIGVQLFFYIHYLIVKGLPTVTDIPAKNKYAKELLYLHDQSKMMIEKTGNGNSTDLSAIIKRILAREEFWLRWKSKSCPNFVKSSKDTVLPMVGGKRKAAEMEGEVDADKAVTVATDNWAELSFVKFAKSSSESLFDIADENVKELARFLADSCPSLDSLMDTYLEADDPDMGIEEEYHPKNDHLFCWRTRRLLAEKNLQLFSLMSNGDLGKGIRKLRNLPEREPKPVIPDDEEKEESEVCADTAAAESKMEEDYDLYDFLKDGNEQSSAAAAAAGVTVTVTKKLPAAPVSEPEDGEVEDV